MDIESGFKIESPSVFVPWNISESKLASLFNSHHLRRVTHGYYTIACTSLGGLQSHLGFHFDPRRNGVLTELEFFRDQSMDLRESFREFQTHLEKSFGKPADRTVGAEGFPNVRWIAGSCEVVHFVFDRFGPEEHVRIRRY